MALFIDGLKVQLDHYVVMGGEGTSGWRKWAVGACLRGESHPCPLSHFASGHHEVSNPATHSCCGSNRSSPSGVETSYTTNPTKPFVFRKETISLRYLSQNKPYLPPQPSAPFKCSMWFKDDPHNPQNKLSKNLTKWAPFIENHKTRMKELKT